MTDLQQALYVDPFDGDFGDGEVKLSDKVVTYRKEYACHNATLGKCSGTCSTGEQGRVIVERWRNQTLKEYRWCLACTTHMAQEYR